ncbi:hypothetical protein FHQ28_05455 [Pasteurellaceae bacterium USgator11]|nr:hypothetical protein FHQ19_09340 [Pasteurellaceae bacterium UScroc12]TNG97733.1 hypothetical protein FHQ24_09985 [Pasteurellaceae bacterium UScroc31]TNH01694.1 hypothetical protein FHQ28_05455 [Pasteurellaceae bacterium USgator11]
MTVIGYDITIIETVPPEDLKIAEGKAGRLARMYAKNRRNRPHLARTEKAVIDISFRQKPREDIAHRTMKTPSHITATGKQKRRCSVKELIR